MGQKTSFLWNFIHNQCFPENESSIMLFNGGWPMHGLLVKKFFIAFLNLFLQNHYALFQLER